MESDTHLAVLGVVHAADQELHIGHLAGAGAAHFVNRSVLFWYRGVLGCSCIVLLILKCIGS